MNKLRVYLTGAHSTGKTTLARWISIEYNLPLITEVARSIVAEQETNLASFRTDLDAAKVFQSEIMRRQKDCEFGRTNFVSDRAFDNIAYAANHTISMSEIHRKSAEYAESLSDMDAVVFFVRPHRHLLKEDGVRLIGSWEEVVRIDGMVKMLLELHDIDYISLDSDNMVERTRAVRGVLRHLT
jgi:nicotinamide riboside kinase